LGLGSKKMYRFASGEKLWQYQQNGLSETYKKDTGNI
jgi:hypothetical protein